MSERKTELRTEVQIQLSVMLSFRIICLIKLTLQLQANTAIIHS